MQGFKIPPASYSFEIHARSSLKMNSIDTAACIRASLYIQHFIQIQPLLINIKMNLMEFKVFYLNRVCFTKECGTPGEDC